MRDRALPLLCLLLLTAPATAPAVGTDPVLTEWQVPWPGSRPRDPYVADSGLVWFVGQRGDYIASFDPRDESFRRIDLDGGAGPHNLIVGADGTVWYAGNGARHIGRVDTASGRIQKIAMPDGKARDPHTLVFDAAGDIWFSVQAGNFVGKLAVATGEVRLLPVPTAYARPYGIVLDRDGTVWATEFGSNKLLSVDPATLKLREVELPRERARPRRLVSTSDGALWYVDYSGGYLGRLDPSSGKIKEWPAPSAGRSEPYGMAVDARDRIWFVETGVDPNRFVGFDTAAERFISSVPLASGGGSVRHMYYHRPGNSIWFGTDANTLGRAQLPQ